MSNPALWAIYANARYEERLEAAQKVRQARAFKATAAPAKRFGRIQKVYWLKPRFRPTIAK